MVRKMNLQSIFKLHHRPHESRKVVLSPTVNYNSHVYHMPCSVGKYLGWKWISDNLIRQQLWPILQKWSRKAIGEEVSEAVITAITKLIGTVNSILSGCLCTVLFRLSWSTRCFT